MIRTWSALGIAPRMKNMRRMLEAHYNSCSLSNKTILYFSNHYQNYLILTTRELLLRSLRSQMLSMKRRTTTTYTVDITSCEKDLLNKQFNSA